MPIIYLSPSTQENNYYVTGGTEEYYMNLLADAMVPYLISNGIQYVRNTPDMTAGSSIRPGKPGQLRPVSGAALQRRCRRELRRRAGYYCVLLSHQHRRQAGGRYFCR